MSDMTRPGRMCHPNSTLTTTMFQHWKGIFLCLALASYLMVEAAPARAGAMKKGGRLVWKKKHVMASEILPCDQFDFS